MRCTCGTIYSIEEWRALPRDGIVDVELDHPSAEDEERIAPFELRTCRVCRSTISKPVPYKGGSPYPPKL